MTDSTRVTLQNNMRTTYSSQINGNKNDYIKKIKLLEMKKAEFINELNKQKYEAAQEFKKRNNNIVRNYKNNVSTYTRTSQDHCRKCLKVYERKKHFFKQCLNCNQVYCKQCVYNSNGVIECDFEDCNVVLCYKPACIQSLMKLLPNS